MEVIKMSKRSMDSLIRALISGLMLFVVIYSNVEFNKPLLINSFKNFLISSGSVFVVFLLFYLVILFTVSIFKELKSHKNSGLKFGLWIFLFFSLFGLIVSSLTCFAISPSDAALGMVTFMLFGLFLALVLGLISEF